MRLSLGGRTDTGRHPEARHDPVPSLQVPGQSHRPQCSHDRQDKRVRLNAPQTSNPPFGNVRNTLERLSLAVALINSGRPC
jgi:hypothetical protein